MKWELSNDNPMGDGFTTEPVLYPRSNENRGQSDDNNKGGASRGDSIARDRELNTTGDGESPRVTEDVNYGVGPYPKGISMPDDEADMEGSGTA